MKKRRTASLLLLLLTTLPLIGCSYSKNIAVTNRYITSVKEYFAPDSRVALFEVETQARNGGIVLTGETNLPEARAALLDSLSNQRIEVMDEIRLLPTDELKGKTYAVVRNSVSNIRSKPSHPAQLSTQALLGMPLKVLKKRGGWYLVQTPDDYLSWVDSGGLTLMNKEEYDKWKASPKLIYLSTFGVAYSEPSVAAARVSDLVAGNVLKLNGREGNFYRTEFPDGRTAYVSRAEAQPFDEWKASLKATEGSLVATAKALTGVPYLWGGTSTKGVDCSGFTKTIYFMNGWVIPRDASQQVHAGESIDTSEGFNNLRPGDLLFFGRPATETSSQRVVHVGMWIGNNEFIHSSGRVRVSSIDPEAENFDEFNLNRFLEAKRYLNHKQGNIIDVAAMYEL